jgi:hypothetical protein
MVGFGGKRFTTRAMTSSTVELHHHYYFSAASSAAELRQAGSSMISSGFWYGTSTGIWYLVSGIWYHTVARSRRIHNKGQWQQQSN